MQRWQGVPAFYTSTSSIVVTQRRPQVLHGMELYEILMKVVEKVNMELLF